MTGQRANDQLETMYQELVNLNRVAGQPIARNFSGGMDEIERGFVINLTLADLKRRLLEAQRLNSDLRQLLKEIKHDES